MTSKQDPDHDDDEKFDALGDYLDRVLRGDVVEAEQFGADLARPDVTPDLQRLERLLNDDDDADANRTPDPELIAGHRILRRLGEGGMGLVYLAEPPDGGPPVALKVLRPERCGHTPSRERFLREAKSIARLNHPHIVAVRHAGQADGALFLAMDYVPGTSLADILRRAQQHREPLDLRRASSWCRSIADALHVAHQAGIVHRDVKPSNLHITPDDEAMLLDFGLARLAGEASLSVTGDFRGTPQYAPPEQVRGDKNAIDARSDVYSLAATLYECTTGSPPFEGAQIDDLFRRILTRDPVSPRSRNASISNDLETIVLKGLEKEPRRRYADAAAMRDDLTALLSMRPISAKPPSIVARTRRWRRRHPHLSRLVIGGIAALTLIAGMQSWRSLQQRRAYDAQMLRVATALDEGDLELATQRLDHARAVRGDVDRDMPEAWHQAARRIEASRHCDRAAVALHEAAGWRETLRAAEEEERDLRMQMASRHLEDHEIRRINALRAETRRAFTEWSGLLREADRALERTAGLEASETAQRALRVQSAMEHWRRARDEADTQRMRRWQATILELDPSSASEELVGSGTLTLQVEPPHAEVHLFRYRELAQLVDRGDRRLVPVPWQSPPTPHAMVGRPCLRITRDLGPLRAEDLILSIAGHPVAETLFIIDAHPDAECLPGDRVTASRGTPVRRALDLERALDLRPRGSDAGRLDWAASPRDNGDEADLVLDAGGERVELSWQDVVDFDVQWGDAAVLAARGDVEAVVWQRGEQRSLVLPEGLSVRATAAPLLCSPQSRTKQLQSLESGSYLAWIRADGYEPVRWPFVMRHGENMQRQLALNASDLTPPEFVRIPAGPARLGGDSEAFLALPSSEPTLEEYWILDREIRCDEYLEFLNDPETLAQAIARQRSRAPRDSSTRGLGGYFAFDDERGFILPDEWNACAVFSVSFRDAVAYAEWRTQRAAAAGRSWHFAVPTEDQWEKAARGADARPFVFGHVFSPTWMESRFSQPDPRHERALSYAIDESVYGVYDLAGGVGECASAAGLGRNQAARGGSFQFQFPPMFRAATRVLAGDSTLASARGFRLVCTLGDP